MQICHEKDAIFLRPTQSTTIKEFPTNSPDVSGATASINGRYPENGFAFNEVSKELVYITQGNGKIVTEKEELSFAEGDVIFIENNEKYYWEGNFSMFMANTPKFSADQHKIVPP